MTATKIENGIYVLHPEGSGWIAAEFRGGKVRGTTEQSNADTHAAANDGWAGVVPEESDEIIDADVAAEIVRLVMGEDTIAEMVGVAKKR